MRLSSVKELEKDFIAIEFDFVQYEKECRRQPVLN